MAQREATGEYLLLLNNDTEVISPRWIEEMLMYAQQDRVGCVGAKLLYPDNTIQHAGIGFGFLTLAAHMHKNFPVGHPGYMGRLVYAQDVYAVTAACLMVRRSVYEQVNGLDESFAVAFNDVDFCVRVREAGYTNVFTPVCTAVPLREQEPRSGREPGQAQALHLGGGALPEAVGKAAGRRRPLHEPEL